MSNSKSIPLIVALVCCLWMSWIFSAQAQTTINTYGQNYLGVHSYRGLSAVDFAYVQFNLPAGTDYRNWSLSIQVPNPIRNSENKIFPSSKISYTINRIEGSVEQTRPTVASLGAITSAVSLNSGEVFLIRNSPFRLYTSPNSHNMFKISYTLTVEGGTYLEQLKTWNQYNGALVYYLKNQNGQLIAQASHPISMQVYPNDTPPVEQTQSIAVNPLAQNVLLEFKTLQDYVNGVVVQFPNALSVSSPTGYAIQLRAVNTVLQNPRAQLPVNIIQVALKNSGGGAPLGSIRLSDVSQNLYQSSQATTRALHFDLEYSTKPKDDRLLRASSDTFSTTLLYTISPL